MLTFVFENFMNSVLKSISIKRILHQAFLQFFSFLIKSFIDNDVAVSEKLANKNTTFTLITMKPFSLKLKYKKTYGL